MKRLMELLNQPAFEGYPDDYLMARIRGRRANLGTPPPVASARRSAGEVAGTEARLGPGTEFIWVYRQMNERLRQTFAPLFLWFEVRTILISLRFRRGGERGEVAGLLATSLLAARVKRVLAEEGEPAAAITEVALLMGGVAEPYRDLGALYRERGGREYEQRFAILYLERMADLPLHPVLREFFRGVIDLRNLLVLSKQLRWGLHEPQAFVQGGTVPTGRLGAVLAKESAAGLANLIGTLPGMAAVSGTPASLEPLLLAWLTGRVRKLARDPLGIGLILDYLWKCRVASRNQGLIVHGEGVERPLLEVEMVR